MVLNFKTGYQYIIIDFKKAVFYAGSRYRLHISASRKNNNK